jgi:hypothetical protein
MCPYDIPTPRLGGSTCDTYDSYNLLVFVTNLRNEAMFKSATPTRYGTTIMGCTRVSSGSPKPAQSILGIFREPHANLSPIHPSPFAVNPGVCCRHGQSTVLYNARRIKDESRMKRGERTIARCSIGIPLVIAARLCISILVTGRPQQGRVPFEV